MVAIFTFVLFASQMNDPGQTEIVQKEIVYKKETTVDLTGSNVVGESELPSTFFLSKMETAKARSLLAERLRFNLVNYNQMGF